MTRRFSQTLYDSALAGLANYESAGFYYTVTGHNLAANTASSWATTWPLNNSNAVSSVQINYGGLETVWRPVSGSLIINIPYVGTQYQLQTITYYSGGNLHVVTYVINQTGVLVAIPTITVNVRVFLYNAPF